jgi:hypothetical protein
MKLFFCTKWIPVESESRSFDDSIFKSNNRARGHRGGRRLTQLDRASEGGQGMAKDLQNRTKKK